jgi:hypothetical protein
MTVKAVQLTSKGMGKGLDLMVTPEHPMDGPMHMARLGYQAMGDLSAIALMADDSRTGLKGRPGVHQAVAWNDRCRSTRSRRCARCSACRSTTCCCRAWPARSAPISRPKVRQPAGEEIRAMVPVNLRPLDKAYQLGNRFGLVPLLLPSASTTRSSGSTRCAPHARSSRAVSSR